MDFNDVATFIRVVDAGSFSGAARALGVPTSTVSRRVARLEDRLGMRLLQRTTRQLSLTDPGRIYYDRCVGAVRDLADADVAMAEIHDEPRGRLRLAAPSDLGGQLWALLDGFLRRYPEVELDLRLEERVVDLVGEGFDVAVRGGPRPESAALVVRKIEETPRLLVASPDYLERHGVPTRVKELSEHRCVLFAPWSPQSSWTLRYRGRASRVSVRGRVTTNNLLTVVQAARAGYGVAQVLESHCRELLEAGELTEVLPDACKETAAMWVVYPSRRNLLPSVRAFVDHLVETWPPLRRRGTPDPGA